jgi:hypothetical protein
MSRRHRIGSRLEARAAQIVGPDPTNEPQLKFLSYTGEAPVDKRGVGEETGMAYESQWNGEQGGALEDLIRQSDAAGYVADENTGALKDLIRESDAAGYMPGGDGAVLSEEESAEILRAWGGEVADDDTDSL